MQPRFLIPLIWTLFASAIQADPSIRVVDIPTRPEVTQRFLFITPEAPKAAVILFAGGHGGLRISDSGQFSWGGGNFLVRSREAFARHGLVVAVVDAPSDRPNLDRFRQSRKHAEDIGALIAWLRRESQVPVWLVGTSRGTQSVGYLATTLKGPTAPDGIVLTASILKDENERAVPEMPFNRLDMPVLVVHHEDDGCHKCLYRDMPRLMKRLANVERKALLTFTGGLDQGNPCQARSHHGFNGLEEDVVGQIAGWIDSENRLIASRRNGNRRN